MSAPQQPEQPGLASRHVPWLDGADVTVEPVPVLRVAGLDVGFRGPESRRSQAPGSAAPNAAPAVTDLSFDVFRSEVLAVVGESGSGKTVTARAILGLLPPTASVQGSITLLGTEVVGADERTLQRLRGNGAAMVFQEPQSALNPVRTVGWQIGEALRAQHGGRGNRAARRRRAVELLELVGIPDPDRRVDAYPHQLSGGQKQRVVIALALANEPSLLIADEPTTALDVTVQAEILRLLDSLRHRLGTAILLITHNMGVVADIADRVLVLRDGRLVEKGEVFSVFAQANAEYTQHLLACVPALPSELAGTPTVASTRTDSPTPVVQLNQVSASYPGRLGRPPFPALHEVSAHVARGEVLGIVGESGSGKTTVARVVAGRLAVSSGSVLVEGVDPRELSTRSRRQAQGRLGVVHQDPATSLDPLHTVGESIAEPLLIHGWTSRRGAVSRVESLLESVHLPRSYLHRRPAELSGGQRQRVALARALALRPALLIADEPTSALDVSVQAVVLELLAELQADNGFACLFISHDLAVVHQFADRVVVMRSGYVVEQGGVDIVLRRPTHDYTKALLASVPVPDPVAQRARRAAADGAHDAAAVPVAAFGGRRER